LFSSIVIIFQVFFYWMIIRVIVHGNADKLGNYPILSLLLDNFSLFLYEFRNFWFVSLNLPSLPARRPKWLRFGRRATLPLEPDHVQTCSENIIMCITQVFCNYIHYLLFNWMWHMHVYRISNSYQIIMDYLNDNRIHVYCTENMS
jgi:hypothetical protein